MKELSIEEKAKCYDEVVAMAKECITYIPDEAVNKYMLNMFPELKESGDEMIRKEIIKLVKFFYGSSLVCKHTISKDKMVAWLEKQGEQNTADKVESKFKVGDWITNGACTWRIDLIEDDLYCSNCDKFTCGGDIKSIDEQYHLWTIEDAKDGDVLVSVSNYPFIYNGKFTELTVGAYCGLNVYGVFVVEKYLKESSWTNNDNIRPATKEQRDILMKEIHRANFKWDADKKELKNCKL